MIVWECGVCHDDIEDLRVQVIGDSESTIAVEQGNCTSSNVKIQASHRDSGSSGEGDGRLVHETVPVTGRTKDSGACGANANQRSLNDRAREGGRSKRSGSEPDSLLRKTRVEVGIKVVSGDHCRLGVQKAIETHSQTDDKSKHLGDAFGQDKRIL